MTTARADSTPEEPAVQPAGAAAMHPRVATYASGIDAEPRVRSGDCSSVATVQVTVEQQIACAPEAAFDLIADARHEPEWNSQVSSTELRSREPIGAGSQFTIVNRGEAFDAVIAAHDRPNALEFRAAGSMELVIHYAFAARNGGTHMTASYDFRPRGALKMLFALMKPVIAGNVRKQLTSFKALCEQRAGE